jgi:hypothetical protein
MQPLRLTAVGPILHDAGGQEVVLQGVNIYLEWYMSAYTRVRAGSSALDIAHLRRALPAANAIRFVGLLWKDSIKPSDGLECSTDDESKGYLDEECMRFVDALIKQATQAGLWVILAARSKYAAGWDLGSAPDVWHDASLKKQMYTMWKYVAERYKDTSRIAGYEIMYAAAPLVCTLDMSMCDPRMGRMACCAGGQSAASLASLHTQHAACARVYSGHLFATAASPPRFGAKRPPWPQLSTHLTLLM